MMPAPDHQPAAQKTAAVRQGKGLKGFPFPSHPLPPSSLTPDVKKINFSCDLRQLFVYILLAWDADVLMICPSSTNHHIKNMYTNKQWNIQIQNCLEFSFHGFFVFTSWTVHNMSMHITLTTTPALTPTSAETISLANILFCWHTKKTSLPWCQKHWQFPVSFEIRHLIPAPQLPVGGSGHTPGQYPATSIKVDSICIFKGITKVLQCSASAEVVLVTLPPHPCYPGFLADLSNHLNIQMFNPLHIEMHKTFFLGSYLGSSNAINISNNFCLQLCSLHNYAQLQSTQMHTSSSVLVPQISKQRTNNHQVIINRPNSPSVYRFHDNCEAKI